MSDKEWGAYFIFGFVCGFVIGTCVGVFVLNLEVRSWREKSIEHGAARYNAVSGKFEWIEKKGEKE